MKKAMILAILLLCISTGVVHAIDYDDPVEGYTKEEVRALTMQCLYDRLPYLQTEIAVLKMEEYCYYRVINPNEFESAQDSSYQRAFDYAMAQIAQNQKTLP